MKILISLFLFAINLINQTLSEMGYVTSVSNYLNIDNRKRSSSLAGGTLIYIKGVGFSEKMGGNVVQIGTSTCQVTGFNKVFIQCYTPKHDREEQLVVKVIADGVVLNCASYICQLRYWISNSPQLKWILPGANPPQQLVSLQGQLMVHTTDVIEFIKAGNFHCNKNDLNISDVSYWNQNGQVSCVTSKYLEGGIYPSQMKGPNGDCMNTYSSQRYDQFGNIHQFKIVPIIQSVSSNLGSIVGQELEIQGSGFSNIRDRIQVYAGGQLCDIMTQDQFKVRCKVQPNYMNTNLNVFDKQVGQSGIVVKEYENINVANDLDQLITEVETPGSAKVGLLSTRTSYDFEMHPFNNPNNKNRIYQMTGLFRANRTGNHVFKLNCRPCQIKLLVSNVANSTVETNLQKLVEMKSGAWYNFRDYDANENLKSSAIQMAQNSYYMIRVYFMPGTWSSAHMSLLAQVPGVSSQIQSNNSISEAQNITIDYKPVFEKMEIVINNVASGTYSMQMNNKARSNLKYNMDAGSMAWNLDRFGVFAGSSVVLQKLDANGKETSDVNAIVTYKYLVTFKYYRYKCVGLKPFIITSGLKAIAGKKISTDVKITQSPSELMSGSFNVTWNGKTVKVDANVNGDYLKRKLMEIGVNPLATVVQKGWNIMTRSYIVYFNHHKGTQNKFSVDSTDLVTYDKKKLEIKVEKVRSSSTDQIYAPVSTEFISTIKQKTQIQMYVNHVKAGCSTNCDYETDSLKVPKIKSFTFTDNELSITVTEINGLTLGNKKLAVEYAEQKCTTITVTTNNLIKCTIKKNVNNKLEIVAGQHIPIVHYDGLGYFEEQNGLAKQTQALELTAIDQQQGSQEGGQKIKVTGNYLPLNMDNSRNSSKTLDVTINNVKCKIISYSNIELVLETPKGTGTQKLTISVNGQSQQLDYAYKAVGNQPTVTAIDKNSVSPSLKSVVILTGTNMDTDKTMVEVFIQSTTDAKLQYPVSISEVTATSIKLIMSGGKMGEYKMLVYRKNFGLYSVTIGQAIAINFKYEFYINSIGPIKGSKQGGTIVTIGGINFSDRKDQMQVFIGTKSVVCSITELTTTSLKCSTGSQPLYDGKEKVTVTQRLIDTAECKDSVNNCEFSYDSASTPVVNDFKDQNKVKQGDVVEYKGSGLDAQVGQKVQMVVKNSLGQETVIDSSSSTATKATFTISGLEAGMYHTQILVGNKGNAKFSLNNQNIDNHFINVDSVVTDINPKKQSQKGNEFVVTGTGFTKTTKIFIGTDKNECEIWKQTLTEIKCFTRKKTGDSMSVIIQEGTVKTTVKNLAVSYVSSKASFTISGTTSSNPLTLEMTDKLTITLTGSKLYQNNVKPTVLIYSKNKNRKIEGTVKTIDDSNMVLEFTGVAADSYKLSLKYGDGFSDHAGNQDYFNVKVKDSSLTVPAGNKVQGYGGGKVVINGHGFETGNIKDNVVKICGYDCDIQSATNSQIECISQGVINQQINDLYLNKDPFVIQPITTTTDTNQQDTYKLFDDKFVDNYYAGKNNKLVFDFGLNMQANLSQIRIFPSMKHSIKSLKNTLIEGSNDGTNYQLIRNMTESSIQPGWNEWISEKSDQNKIYRYIRLSFNSLNTWKHVSEVQFVGLPVYVPAGFSMASAKCDLEININKVGYVKLSQVIEYRQDKTATVTSITPNMGSTAGNIDIVIVGTNFGTVKIDVQVLIDKIACVVATVTNTQINCKTGARPIHTRQELRIYIKNVLAANNGNKFVYIEKWSEQQTWGGENPPKEGDSVHIPKGQNLLLDISPPKLNTIMVEGQLIFQDKDLKLEAHYIVSNGGNITIGTYETPITKKIEIVLHGKREDKQLPMYGNKVLAMNKGILDIHGQKRAVTWTTLSETADQGTDVLKLNEAVDWKVGEIVGIATSTFSYNNSECRSIVQVIDTKTIKLNQTLDFKHYSAIETHDGQQVKLLTEVGLLTRNIVIKGAPGSWESGYGGHLMIHGKQNEGTIGRISYAEFFNLGQQTIIGRYSIHFHVCGNMFKSFVEGNAVHHALARVVTIHGTHYIKIKKNVGYFVYGHNYFLEDGIESYNTVENNLAMKTVELSTLLVSDQTAASYWITRPNNYIKGNHAAGGDWYGFWYEIHKHPIEFNSNPDICPQGEKILEFSGNVAHGMTKYGIRINKLASRTNPCDKERNDFANGEEGDPTAHNPPVLSIFSDFLAFKCRDNGVQGEYMGHVKFINMKLVENRLAGAIIHRTNFTSHAYPTILENLLIVGYSSGNAEPLANNHGSIPQAAIVTPRTDEILIKNVQIVNFDKVGQEVWQTCALCWHKLTRIQGGATTAVEKIKYVGNINSYMRQINTQTEIIHDKDGTMTGEGKESYVALWRGTYTGINDCKKVTAKYPEPIVICDGTKVQIRAVQFYGMQPHNLLYNAVLKVDMVAADHVINITTITEDKQGKTSPKPLITTNDIEYSTTIPLVTNNNFHVMFNDGVDFDQMVIRLKDSWKKTDKGVLLRFKRLKKTEAIETLVLRGTKEQKKFQTITKNMSKLIDHSQLKLGEGSFDNYTSIYDLQIAGDLPSTAMLVTPIACVKNCPDPTKECLVDKNVKKWSDVNIWPNKRLPQTGEDVEILCPWVVLLDIKETPIFNKLLINGELLFDKAQSSTTLKAKYIHIRQGKLLAGQKDKSFTNNIRIELHGNQQDSHLLIDPYVDPGNKGIAVTGELSLYGVKPKIVQTRLMKQADIGATELTVVENVDWKVGQTIVIGPTEGKFDQQEYRKILSVAGNIVTISNGLSYFHYGSESTISTSQGILDMRAVVAMVDRNIQIVGVMDKDQWGGHVVVASERLFDTNSGKIKSRVGYANIHGVQFINTGQKSSLRGGLSVQYTDIAEKNTRTEVDGCSFTDSMAICVYIKESKNVTFTNNILTKCVKYGIAAYQKTTLLKINGNFFTDIQQRDVIKKEGKYDYVGAVSFQESQTKSELEVHNNTVQGIDGIGFIAAGVACKDQNKNYLKNNDVGSSQSGMVPTSNTSCYAITGVNSYKNIYGIITQYPSTQIIVDKMIFAENEKNMHAQFAHGTVHDVYFTYTDLHFIGVARTDCPNCYKDKKSCSSMKGIIVPIIQAAPQKVDDIKSISNVEKLCTNAVKDARVMVNNLRFENFKIKYTESAFSNCENNHMIHSRANQFDTAGNFYVHQTLRINSDLDALIKYDEKPAKTAGWLGGCGAFGPCTGVENFYLTDFDGKLLGKPGQTVHFNRKALVSRLSCTQYKTWDGYLCNSHNLRLFSFENTGSDKFHVMYHPELQTTLMDKPYKPNMYKEWDWEGPIPKDKRLPLFLALVQKNIHHKVLFDKSDVPKVGEFMLQHFPRSQGVNKDYLILDMNFTKPGMVVIKANGTEVQPNKLKDNIDLETQNQICGAHNFKYLSLYIVSPDTRNLQVVLTSECMLTYQLTNAIKVTMHLTVDINSFYQNNGLTTFVDKMCAFLGIPTNRMRIVNVRSGSVYVDHMILSDDQSDTADMTTETNKLNSLADKIKNGHSSGKLDVGYPVKDISTTVMVSPPSSTGTTTNTNNDTKTDTNTNTNNSNSIIGSDHSIIALVVVSVLLVIIITTALVLLVIKGIRRQNQQKIQIQSCEDENNQLDEKQFQNNIAVVETGRQVNPQQTQQVMVQNKNLQKKQSLLSQKDEDYDQLQLEDYEKGV